CHQRRTINIKNIPINAKVEKLPAKEKKLTFSSLLFSALLLGSTVFFDKLSLLIFCVGLNFFVTLIGSLSISSVASSLSPLPDELTIQTPNTMKPIPNRNSSPIFCSLPIALSLDIPMVLMILPIPAIINIQPKIFFILFHLVLLTQN